MQVNVTAKMKVQVKQKRGTIRGISGSGPPAAKPWEHIARVLMNLRVSALQFLVTILSTAKLSPCILIIASLYLLAVTLAPLFSSTHDILTAAVAPFKFGHRL